MALKCGIVGLLMWVILYSIVYRMQSSINKFSFCTIEPNMSTITVPDERLTKLKN